MSAGKKCSGQLDVLFGPCPAMGRNIPAFASARKAGDALANAALTAEPSMAITTIGAVM